LAKEAAETNSANVTAIIEGTTENIWAFNKNYEILYINHSFQKEFHQAFGVWLVPGSNLISALPDGIQSIWKERYNRVLRNEQFTIEDAIDTEIGKVFVQVIFNPILKKGEVHGGSCFGSNITGRKMAELELLKAKEKAEESDRLKSAFLANMSHEIRTPMNGILGFARLLDKPDLESDKKHEYITVIQKSGIRMLNIINDIIDISKIEAGLMKLDMTESNINEQVNYIYTFFKPEVEAKGMELICLNSLPARESVIVTDREKLFAILINLVKNAIKYSLEGTIEFGYLKKDSRLEFFVKDTGIGIPKDRHDAIFERFIQADIEDKMARQGAGLGLAISKAYIEMLGGKIWVESEPGTGSTFYFTLPMNTSGEIKENSHLVAQNEEIKEIELAIKKIKILIAEDDEISEKLLRNLVRNLGKEIISSKTGIETIDLCRKNPDIDLILMDIQMPQLNGYIATQKIREFNKNVVIIAQTANGLLGDREKAIEAGCNDYIAKPIDTVELLAMISQHFADQ
jgi:signal transduction histidine kinase/CheY-like chemotaxis protein